MSVTYERLLDGEEDFNLLAQQIVTPLIQAGRSAREEADAIDVDNPTLRVAHSDQFDTFFEQGALRIAANTLLGSAYTIRQFPALAEVLGEGWKPASTSPDLVLPKSAYKLGREHAAGILSHKFRTHTQMHNSPANVRAMAQLLSEGFSYKVPDSGFDESEFDDLREDCNKLIKYLLLTITRMDDNLIDLRSTTQLLDPAILESLKDYDPAIIDMAMRGFISYLKQVFRIVARKTSDHVNDSLLNVLVVIEARMVLYQVVLGNFDPADYAEA
jgi:hypothetical protein